MTFYRFARLADDVADSSTLNTSEKLDQLDHLEAELLAPTGRSPEVAALKSALDARNLSNRHALDLLVAFRRDARNQGCESWDTLMDYCRYSAMPVGRFLLALTGEEDDETHAASDALCAALQITNHLKDLKSDFASMERNYLPRDWMTTYEVDLSALTGAAMSPPLRNLLVRMLEQTAELVEKAAPLPRLITHRGLRLQAAVSVACAQRLLDKLSKGDPLATDLSLGRRDWLACVIRGLSSGRGR